MAQDNKTERASPRKREKAREKGQVPRSRDLSATCAALAATMLLANQMSHFPHAWGGFLRDCLDGAVSDNLRMDGLPPFLAHSGVFVATAMALAASWVVAIALSLAQGGVVFAPSALMPSGARLNPGAKLGQIFSISALRGLMKSLLPAAAVAYLAIACLRRDWLQLLTLPGRTARGVLSFIVERVFEVGWKASLVLLAWAVVDYLFERQHHESELRMSKQDVRDEYKETEGNPVIKQRIRRLQHQVRRRRMLEDTKRASVVITNPTEYAIAIEYGPDMPAPVVVAKGRNRLAAEIKEIARWQGIPMVENLPLAHVLYRTVEVGQSVPPKLYAVIAEVLAAIYRAQARAMAAGAR
jgi:flagellar biosynthetic protein FlhB